ncbi:MAG: DUF402 domain-containing protein [Actinomycetota bacterium]
MGPRWRSGDLIVRREVLGMDRVEHPEPLPAWYGRAWEALPVFVVEDSDEHLVTFIPEGAELGFVAGDWPTPDGLHPWFGRERWQGHGCLMIQRPGDPYAVWHFWNGPERDFLCWYINLQADFRRTSIGYDTEDFELDFVVFPDGTWVVKDLEKLDDRVNEGRYSDGFADWVRTLGDEIKARLDARDHWWDRAWAGWVPPESWTSPDLPAGWETADPDQQG